MEEEKPCQICGGKGVIEVDDLNAQLCSCAKRRMLKRHLGPEIFGVEHVVSPLYVLGPKRGQPTTDKTRTNLFIHSSWSHLLPHLKWVLFYKGLNYRFRIETDERILSVRLGKESSALKTRAEKEGMSKSFNSLSDLVGETDLFIVRLGFLGHKNSAAAGYLKEALMIREVANKATWVIEDPSVPFEEGHRTYSTEVFDYITNHFEFVDFEHKEESEGTESTTASPTNVLVDTREYDEDARPAVDEDTDMGDSSPGTGFDMSAFEPVRDKKPKWKKTKKWGNR